MAESFEEGANISEAARRNGVARGLLDRKRMDRVKLLAWDGSGMVLVTKWLHQGRFTLPRQRLRSIPQTTFARKPQTKSQNLANSNTVKSPINVAVQGVPCSSRTTRACRHLEDSQII